MYGLQRAAQQLSSGDLTARAPEGGSAEIAYVAGAFNKMAAELSARDEALSASDRLRRQMLADVAFRTCSSAFTKSTRHGLTGRPAVVSGYPLPRRSRSGMGA